MSESPFFQFYPSDWLAGTRGLSAAETGVYITLIALMYEREAPLSIDPKRLARLCGCTHAAFKKAVQALVEEGKISNTENGLWNERVQKANRKTKNRVGKCVQTVGKKSTKSKDRRCGCNAGAMRRQC